MMTLLIKDLKLFITRRHSRSSQSRKKTKRMLNKKMYPSNPPAPIQYQFESTKIPRAWRIWTPNVSGLSVKLTCAEQRIQFEGNAKMIGEDCCLMHKEKIKE